MNLSLSQIYLRISHHFEECNSIAFSYSIGLGAAVNLLGVSVAALCSLKAFTQNFFNHLALIILYPEDLLLRNSLLVVFSAEASFTWSLIRVPD